MSTIPQQQQVGHLKTSRGERRLPLKRVVALLLALLVAVQYRSTAMKVGTLRGSLVTAIEENIISHNATLGVLCPSPLEYKPNLRVDDRSHSVASWSWTKEAPRVAVWARHFKRRSGDQADPALSPQQQAYNAYKHHIDSKIATLPTFGNACPRRPAFSNEFGYEIQGVIPWYYEEHLRTKCDLTVIGMPGSRYPYWWSKNWTVQPGGQRTGGYLPKGSPMGANPHVRELPKVNWTMPPWREFFADTSHDLDRIYPRPDLPLAVIFNKHTKEWDVPKNFINVESLRDLLSILSPLYQVVYVRMESNKLGDQSENVPFEDKTMIRKEFPGTVLLDPDVYNETTMEYNLLLFGIAAKASLFVSVQGGTSVIASLWGVPNFIYAVMGQEIDRGTFSWYGKLSGSDIGDSLVTVYNYRNELVLDVWRWVHCRLKHGNGTIEEYAPVQGWLFDRATYDESFVP